MGAKNIDNSGPSLKKTKMLVLTGLLFALALVFSMIENAIPPLPITVPGVKFGLSNIVVMFALFFIGTKEAFAIAVLKSIFVILVRGAVAGFLSFFGGVFSVIVMASLILIFRTKISYLIVSIFGSIFHNIGQFIAISIVYTSLGLWAYIPILLISGVVAGIITATMLRILLPAFKKLGIKT